MRNSGSALRRCSWWRVHISMASDSCVTVMNSRFEQLAKLGSKLLDLQAIEPVVAMRCLNCAAVFVQMARSLDAFLFLYWLCVLVAVATAAIGLGGVGAYVLRTIAARSLTRAGEQPTPD